MWECKHCKQLFNFIRNTDKANHTRHCIENPSKLDSYKNIKIKINDYNDKKFGKVKKYKVVCNCCSNEFFVKERELQFPRKSKYFCNRNCANSTGGKAKAEKHHRDDVAHYTTVCFRHHEKECIVCGENKIVAVHHNDCNHYNNDPNNLIPLCPTHHQYVHSRYKNEVQPIIDDYLKKRALSDNGSTLLLQSRRDGS